MAFPLVVLYFLSLTALGTAVLRKVELDALTRLFAGFAVGALLAGLYMFALAQVFAFTALPVLGFAGLAAAVAVLQGRALGNGLRETWRWWREHVVQRDSWSRRFAFAAAGLLLVLFLLADTPPRAGDAMRYHLALIRDMVEHSGQLVRPYYHYNFPNYFNLVFAPLYFLVGGAGMQLANFCLYLGAVLGTLVFAVRAGVTRTRLLFFLILLVPSSFMLGTIAYIDWALVFFAMTGLLCLQAGEPARARGPLVLAFLSLGLAMGTKHQALAFVPWFALAAYRLLDDAPRGRRLAWTAGLLGVAVLVASPFYFRNLLVFHNPVWPMAAKLFPSGMEYWDLGAARFAARVQGGHNPGSVLQSVVNVGTDLLTPVPFVLLGLAGAFTLRRDTVLVRYGILLYFLAWWVMQPVLYTRFLIYPLPILCLGTVALYEWLGPRLPSRLRVVPMGVLAGLLAYGLGLLAVYSKFYLEFHFHRDLDKYHVYTPYYRTFQWMGAHTPEDAKVLCMLGDHLTYYLPRDYLVGDPGGGSVLIDWRTLRNGADLLRWLRAHGVDYILLQQQDWSRNPSGAEMTRAIDDLLASGAARVVHVESEKFYSGRVLQQFKVVDVAVIRVGD